MNRWFLPVCIVASLGLWAWGLSGRPAKEGTKTSPLTGSFVIFGFELPESQRGGQNPYRFGVHTYEFRDDGSFLFRKLLSGVEVSRSEGTITSRGPDRIWMQVISRNRTELPEDDAERKDGFEYVTSWHQDPEGKFLELKLGDDGPVTRLRPYTPKE